MRSRMLAAPLVALALLGAACGKSNDVADAPSLEGPSTQTSQGPAPGTRIPLSNGVAKLRVTGDVAGSYSLGKIIPASFTAPSDGKATIGWQDPDLNGVSLLGEVRKGSVRTSPEMVLDLTAGCGSPGGCSHFHSAGGECAVTIVELETDGTISGRFTCADIEGTGGETGLAIDASGTFSASA